MGHLRIHDFTWVLPAALFGLSALGKAIQGGFQAYLTSTHMFPRALVAYIAAVIIAAELFTALLLLRPRWRRAGWQLAGGLGAAFAAYHGALLILGDTGICSCIGVQITHNAFWNHVVLGALCAGVVLLAFAALCRPRIPAGAAAVGSMS